MKPLFPSLFSPRRRSLVAMLLGALTSATSLAQAPAPAAGAPIRIGIIDGDLDVKHEAFKGSLPYNVAIVELAEGPRMVTNLTNLEGWDGPVADRPCELVIEEDLGRRIPRFRLLAES